MKTLSALFVFALATGSVLAEEPDGLILPPGFHANVVAEGLGPVRHLAVRDNGDIYISTPVDKQGKGGGIIALHLDSNHKADQTMHFGAVDGGTGIRFDHGALYATSATGIYRFTFRGKELVPAKEPEVIVEGMPALRGLRAQAGKLRMGRLFVGIRRLALVSGALSANPPLLFTHH